MARNTGRRAGKAGVSSPPSTGTSTTSASAGPPAPWQYAPASIQPFLSSLPTSHVYLVHLDHSDTTLKKRVFTVPVAMNLVIAALLCVRIYYAVPVYLTQLITIFGYDTEWTVDTGNMRTGELVSTVAARTGLLMLDYCIFVLLGSWPREFAFGSSNSRFVGPWAWRRTLGFRPTEIVVRSGRKWDTQLLEGGSGSGGDGDGDGDTSTTSSTSKAWTVEDELALKVKIEPALRPAQTAKTGYLLLDRDWDLDFKGMLDAHRLADKGTIVPADLDGLALAFHQGRWLTWRVREQESAAEKDAAAARGGGPRSAPADTVLARFRKALEDLRASDVFYRWIEIVQFETNRPGGFTQARRTEAVGELKARLGKKGVDFATFWERIGGEAGLPGFDEQEDGTGEETDKRQDTTK